MSYPLSKTGLQPHRGGLILALGLIGFLICFPLGLVAYFMSRTDQRNMDAGIVDPSGRSSVQVGGILGLVSAILGIAWTAIVLIVIIVPLFLATALISVAEIQDDSQTKIAEADAKMLEDACKMYKLDVGSFPSKLDDLVQPPASSKTGKNWRGPYIGAGRIPLDPWENVYQYEADDQAFFLTVWSMGPDGQPGTQDDIYRTVR